MLVLTTARLRLRWFAPGDEAYLLEQLQEPSWKTNISDPGVQELGATRFWMEQKLLPAYWGEGLGLWAVELKGDGALRPGMPRSGGTIIGMAGILQREYLPVPDVGYAFLPRFWGQGYAREAVRACVDYAREVLGEPRLMASTEPSNAASGRVLEAVGMRYLETRLIGDHPAPSKLYALGELDEGNERDQRDEAADEDARIAELLRRFFLAFSNRDGRSPTLAALPYWLLPQALVSRADDAGVHRMTVREFVLPRLELLRPGGRLQQFEESIVEQGIDRYGRIAQVWLRYRKQGLLDGQSFEAEGVKTLQLLNTGRRWQIAALAWEDLA